MSEKVEIQNSPWLVERPIDMGRVIRYQQNGIDPYLSELLQDRSLVEFAANGLWEVAAACRGGQVKLDFFQEKIRPNSFQGRQIKAICGQCPVKEACRVAAFLTPEEKGVWGGLFPTERVETLAGQKSLGKKEAKKRNRASQLEDA